MAPSEAIVKVIGIKAPNLPAFSFQLDGIAYYGRVGQQNLWAVLSCPGPQRKKLKIPRPTSQSGVAMYSIPGITRTEVIFSGTDFDKVTDNVLRAASMRGAFSRAAMIRQAFRPVLICVDQVFGTRACPL